MIATLFQYSLGVSIPLIIMWTTYHWGLAGEKRFALNRCVLLAIYGISLFLQPVLQQINPLVVMVYPISGDSTEPVENTFDWIHVFSIIWISGALITTLLTIIEIVKIYLLAGSCEKIIYGGHTVFITDDIHQAPFSFARSIIINRRDYEESATEILTHEEGHLSLLHSYDMIVAQVVAILCWYNPIAWLMRSELKSVHEYQADFHALNRGLDVRQYQLLLIGKATGTKFPSIGNNFNNSKLKNRIIMINRSSQVPANRKLLYLLPLAAVAVAGFLLTSPVIKAAVTPRTIVPPAKIKGTDKGLEDMKIIVDGKEISLKDLNGEVDPSSIKSITVSKDKSRIIVNTKNE